MIPKFVFRALYETVHFPDANPALGVLDCGTAAACYGCPGSAEPGAHTAR